MKKTLLYEYFVRVNFLILSKQHVSEEEIKKDTKMFNELGFIRTTELIELTESNTNKYHNYEEFFLKVVIPYLNEIK